MQETINIEEMITELKKKIALLEWDIPKIKNTALRSIKEYELIMHKEALELLLEKSSQY